MTDFVLGLMSKWFIPITAFKVIKHWHRCSFCNQSILLVKDHSDNESVNDQSIYELDLWRQRWVLWMKQKSRKTGMWTFYLVMIIKMANHSESLILRSRSVDPESVENYHQYYTWRTKTLWNKHWFCGCPIVISLSVHPSFHQSKFQGQMRRS